MNGVFSTGTDPFVALSSFCFSPELTIRTFAYDMPCLGRDAGSNVIGGFDVVVSLSLNECGGFMVVGVCCVSRLISLSSDEV